MRSNVKGQAHRETISEMEIEIRQFPGEPSQDKASSGGGEKT